MLKRKLSGLLKNASVFGLMVVTSATPTWAQGIRHDSRFVYAQPTSACCQTIASHVAGAAIPGYPMAMQVLPFAWSGATTVQGQCACDANGVISIVWDGDTTACANIASDYDVIVDGNVAPGALLLESDALLLNDDKLSVLPNEDGFYDGSIPHHRLQSA